MAKRDSSFKATTPSSKGVGRKEADVPNEKSKPTAAQLRTRTLPESQRGVWFEDPDVVTWLRAYDTAAEFELPREKKTFTLGSSPDGDIMIPNEALSRVHCLIERRGQVLRIHDEASKNGTFFGGRRETVFDLRPGASFTVASLRLLAMNDEMRAAYPTLADIVGSEDEHTSGGATVLPSDVIVLATLGANVLVTGEAGCEQARLARTIHAISLLRSRPLVECARVPDDRTQQRALLDRASRSTLMLTMDERSPIMDTAFASMLFSRDFHVRVIVNAPSLQKATDVLGDTNVRPMRQITLRPLAYRAGAIHHLLDRLFAERGTELRVSDMSAYNQAALQAHGWPDNFDDLRIAADQLPVIARAPSLRQAAKEMNISHSTLHHWFSTQLELSFPLDGQQTEK